MPNRIFIDGTDYTNLADGLEEVTITYSRDESDSITVSITSTIGFTGAAYDYLYNKFYANKKDALNEISNVTLFIDCCEGFEFLLQITPENLQHCGCEILATMSEVDNEKRCFNFLRNNHFLDPIKDEIRWAEVGYCEGFDIIDYIILVIFPFLLTLEALEELIIIICKGLDFIVDKVLGFFPRLIGINVNLIKCGKDPIPFSLDNVLEIFGDCKWYQPSPFVEEIIRVNAERCGLGFVSSILQNPPYVRMTMFMAQYQKGCIKKTGCKSGKKYIEENFPIWTTVDLLERLKTVMPCAKYEIIDGTLYFENEDFFKNFRRPVILNIEEAVEEGCVPNDQEPCYTFIGTEACAFGRFSYTADAQDKKGNEAFRDYYSDIVEWNKDPVNDWQKGECPYINEFGPVRFQRDKYIDCGIEVFRRIFGHTHKVSITAHTASQIKLIVLINDDIENASPIRRPRGEESCPGLFAKITGGKFQTYDYNYPMWYREDYDLQELYQLHGSCKDPRDPAREVCQLSSFTFVHDCEHISTIINNSGRVRVATRFGFGYPESITIDPYNGTTTLSNIEIGPQ